MDYRKFVWTQRFEYDERTWIDVQAFDVAWATNDPEFYIKGHFPKDPDSCWCKYCRFCRWIKAEIGPIIMPEIAIHEDQASFINGRHRFAWMRNNGVQAIPIATHPDDKPYIKKVFGRPKPNNSFVVPRSELGR